MCLTCDTPSREVRLDGHLVPLTKTEFNLLHHLLDQPNRVFTRNELLTDVWGWPATTTHFSRTVDTTAGRLRRKLGGDFIANVWGVGYRLTAALAYTQ